MKDFRKLMKRIEPAKGGMAASGVRVSCSGAVLSSLLYEQLRSGHAQVRHN